MRVDVSDRTGIDASSLVESIRSLVTASKSMDNKRESPTLRATKRMLKSKREMLRSERMKAYVVDATRAWIEYQVRLKAHSMIQGWLIYY